MGIFRQFPYSNFHDMNMDPIIKIMREMQDEWTATKAEWASYKDFIDNYFANLDLSEEVLAAIHTMAYDGSLNEVMDPVIITQVAAWLNSHITPTTPALDKTLLIADAAAESQYTGFAVNDVKAKTTAIGISAYDLIKDSGMYQATGIQYPIIGRTTTGFIPVEPNEIYYITNSTGVALNVFEFEFDYTTSAGINERLVFNNLGTHTSDIIKTSANTHFIRAQIVEDIANVRDKIQIIKSNFMLLNCVTPSMFESDVNNTDAKALQACFTFAIANKCDVAIDRMYTLAANEIIRLNKYNTASADRFKTRVFGLTGGIIGSDHAACGITKNAAGYIFLTNDAYCWSGDFVFEDLNFYSTEGAGTTVFDFTRLMRVTVNHCFFKNVDCVGSNNHTAGLSSQRDDYWQSVTFRSCTVIGGKGYAFDGTGCYDTLFDKVLIEHRDGGIRFKAYTEAPYTYFYYFKCRRLTIRDCCIEGLSGANIQTVLGSTPVNGCAIYLDNALCAEISNCYFEQNYRNIVIDASVVNNGEFDGYAAIINNCWLGGTFNKNRYGDDSNYADIVDSFQLVEIIATKGSYSIENCGSERGGIVNVANEPDIEVIYNHNNKSTDATGSYSFTSYTYDTDTGRWSGNTPRINDTSVITSQNVNESACVTYEKIALA